MEFTRRNLPHISLTEADYFVTYRQKGTWPLGGMPNEEGILCQPEIGNLVLEDWIRRDSQMINLHAVCIMPDHVHVVVSPIEPNTISKLMSSHKRHTAWLINNLLNRKGPFWQDESYDRILRDGKLHNAIDYTLNNPVKAGFVANWRDWEFTYLAEVYR